MKILKYNKVPVILYFYGRRSALAKKSQSFLRSVGRLLEILEQDVYKARQSYLLHTFFKVLPIMRANIAISTLFGLGEYFQISKLACKLSSLFRNSKTNFKLSCSSAI